MVGIHEKAPFLRLAPPFLIGIVLAIHYPVSLSILFTISGTLFLFIVFYRWTIGRNEIMIHRHWHGIVLNVFFFATGMALVGAQNPQRDQHHISLNSSFEFLTVRVDAAPVEKEKSIKIEAEILEGKNDGVAKPCIGRVIYYLAKDSLSENLRYGDMLMVKNSLKEISAPRNPFEFDYKEYLHNHFIQRQGYAGSQDWLHVGFAPRLWHYDLFISFRDRLLEKMKQLDISGQEYAVLSALVLGKTDEIDYHLMLSYSSSGAIHVLAVSGLHVGLIFIVLSWILAPLKKLKGGTIISSLLAGLIIWLYAGITGFSPSVLRATVMFTAMLCAGFFFRKPNIFNTLFFSAIGLLVWNPYYIMEVGFQLSYLAVLGIIVLYRKIYNWFFIRNWLADKLWSLTAISIAAQAVTFPLGMLYFHQFPNLFLVSNLFVIPLSSLILYLSLIMFALGWFNPAAQFLAGVVSFLTRVMNNAVQLVDEISWSLWQGISITVPESYFLYGIVIFLSSWAMWKRPRHLFYTTVFVLLLIASQTIETFHQTRHEEICLHALRGGIGVTYTSGDHTYFLHSGIDVADESFVRFHLKNYWDNLGNDISKIDLDSIKFFSDAKLHIQENFLLLGTTSILIANKEHNKLKLDKMPAEFILCTKSYSPKEENFPVRKTIILDDDVYATQANRMSHWFELHDAHCMQLNDHAIIIRDNKPTYFNSIY